MAAFVDGVGVARGLGRRERCCARRRNQRSSVSMRRREWMEDPGAESPSQGIKKYESSSGGNSDGMGDMVQQGIPPADRFDPGSLEELEDGVSVFNTIIIVGSTLALAATGLGPPLAKKLFLSSLSLSSMSGFGAFWISRSLMSGKLPILNKSIRVSDSESTMTSYIRNLMSLRLADGVENAPRLVESELTESYFPTLYESEMNETLTPGENDVPDVMNQTPPPTKNSLPEVRGEFSDWSAS